MCLGGFWGILGFGDFGAFWGLGDFGALWGFNVGALVIRIGFWGPFIL